MKVATLVLGLLQTNCYLVWDEATKRAVVIDPAAEAHQITSRAKAEGIQIVRILATHAHFDHVLGAAELSQATGAPFSIHRDDEPILLAMQERAAAFLGLHVGSPPKVDGYLKEGDEVELGTQPLLRVIHTPGHSPGSISLFDGRERAFVGDVLFAGSIGRTDLPGGSYEALLRSIQEKLVPLGSDVVVYPGHGPSTTIAREQQYNPFLQPPYAVR
ncbi:MAG: MBL fold metallo-hydrolase [Chloroflexi bacterium]|nr:MBL fold metallo-hydrolase [Chloroflexota bacterium]